MNVAPGWKLRLAEVILVPTLGVGGLAGIFTWFYCVLRVTVPQGEASDPTPERWMVYVAYAPVVAVCLVVVIVMIWGAVTYVIEGDAS